MGIRGGILRNEILERFFFMKSDERK